jgi:hypothetical protein
MTTESMLFSAVWAVFFTYEPSTPVGNSVGILDVITRSSSERNSPDSTDTNMAPDLTLPIIMSFTLP